MTYFISSSWWAREATTLLRVVTILRISARNSRFPSVVFSSSLLHFANMLVAVTDESLDLAKEKATAEFTLSPLNRKEKLLCSVLKQIKNQGQMRKMVKSVIQMKETLVKEKFARARHRCHTCKRRSFTACHSSSQICYWKVQARGRSKLNLKLMGFIV